MRRIALWALLIVAPFLDGRADGVEVRLASGRRITASSAQRVGDVVVVQIGGATMKFPSKDVVSIAALTSARPAAGLNLPANEVLPGTGDVSAAGETSPVRASQGGLAAGIEAAISSQALLAHASEAQLRARLVANPSDAEARLELGQRLLDAVRLTDAVEHLRQIPATATLTVRRSAALALSQALSRLDRLDEARAALDAVPADATIEKARARLEAESIRARSSAALSSIHFIVSAPPGTDALKVHGLLAELESAHEEIRSSLGAAPTERIVVEILPGDQFWESTGQDRSVIGLYDGKVHVPAGRMSPPSRALRTVLRHEIAHAFVDALTAGRADPTWHEGVAEHFEGDDVTSTQRALAAAARGDGSWPPAMTHEVAHARMEWFLGRFGMSSLAAVLAAMPSRGIDGALQSVVGLDTAGLDAAWRRDAAAASR